MLTLVDLRAEPWTDLLNRLEELGRVAGHGALVVGLGLTVMLVGWAIATLVSRLVAGVLHALRFDAGVERVLGSRATARHAPAGVAAWAVYWAMMAGAALLALETMGFSLAASVADRLSEVLPRIVTSAVLFAVGSLIAMLVGGTTRRFLASADIRAARLQGQIVSFVLTGFAALLALEQLGFAAQFVMALGVVVVAAAGIAAALAFGLGGRDLARDFVVEYLRSLDEDGPKRPL